MTQYEVNDCFKRKNPSDVEFVLQVVDLLFYKETSSNKLLALYNLLGQDLFIKVCLLLDGEELSLPTSDTMTENMTFAICYLERFAHKMEWSEIKKKYPSLAISSLKFSTKAQSLEDYMRSIIEGKASEVETTNLDTEDALA